MNEAWSGAGTGWTEERNAERIENWTMAGGLPVRSSPRFHLRLRALSFYVLFEYTNRRVFPHDGVFGDHHFFDLLL